MLQFIKKNYKVPLAIICILILLWVHQYKKANEIDLTNLSTLNQICELLNLPMDVVFPEGATEHHFSKDVRNGRGIYTVLFRPYVHTKDDYDAWMTHLKDTSKQISTDGILVKQFSTNGSRYCSDRWYIIQQKGPDANIIVSWSDGDYEDGVGMLKMVFEMY